MLDQLLLLVFFFPVTWIMFLPPLLCSLSVQPLLFVACQEIPRTMPYTKGMQIEVSKVENDSVVAWLPAVVAKNIWKNNLLVEYTVSKSGGIALSEEIVDVKHVRPCPPQASAISFCINDEVEAFQGGGWWLGVITEVHPELKYTIKSIHLGVEVQLSQKLLRLRYDWVDGQWKQESQVCTNLPRIYISFKYLLNMNLMHLLFTLPGLLCSYFN